MYSAAFAGEQLYKKLVKLIRNMFPEIKFKIATTSFRDRCVK